MKKEERFTETWRKSELAHCTNCGISLATFSTNGLCRNCNDMGVFNGCTFTGTIPTDLMTCSLSTDITKSKTNPSKKSRLTKSWVRKEIEKFNGLNKNQVNPNRYFSGYEDCLRMILREMQKK